MTCLRLVLGDQLSASLSSLGDLDPKTDTVVMFEVAEETTYVPHHKQKIVLVLSAMRHFAEELRTNGISVDYVHLGDPANTGSFTTELERAVQRHGASRLILTEPSEWRVLEAAKTWETRLGIPVEIRPDDRFLASREDFAAWAQGRKHYRMEFFYRDMRSKTGILMDGPEPVGGQWNYDSENRKRLPAKTALPPRQRFAADVITREVMALVAERFPENFGDLEPFGWAVTREDALVALDNFIQYALPSFGDYQDAMKAGEPFLFHSLLSPYLNLGLLLPLEVCQAAESAWHSGHAPLNAVEGFIRQILGWREYVRGLYWLTMPVYATRNALNAHRDLPALYWGAPTDLNCLSQSISDIRQNAYGHHIQRLMVTGNFALLTAIEPAQIEAWYLAVYCDAFEWVELPNVHGMALYADGGLMASKPYAASGAYIHKMSDYCSGCAYDPAIKLGPGACPFNYLYWNFLIENQAALKSNPRLAMPYKTLSAFTPERRTAIKAQSQQFLAGLYHEQDRS
jgi:deoxyribodipyrimidine photolyase-related protein